MLTTATKTYLAQFLANGSLFSAGIFVPIVIGKQMNASPLEIGLVVTGYATAVFIASVTAGRAADVRGRRVFLRIGFFVATIACLLQIFATSVMEFLLVRAFLGSAAGVIQSVLVAYFIYETKGKVGIFSSIGALGWGTGSLIAGIIGYYLLVFTFSAGLMLIATILIYSLPRTEESKFNMPLFPREVFRKNYPIYLSVLIRHTGANFVWVTYPLFLIDVLHANELWVGIIYMVNAFGQFFVMSRLDPYDSSRLIHIGFILSALTFFGFSLAQTVIEIIPIQVTLAFAWSALYVGSLKYVNERNKEKATSTGWLQGMISIAGIIGPAIGGTLDVAIGYRLTMISAMAMSLAGLVVFFIAKNRSA